MRLTGTGKRSPFTPINSFQFLDNMNTFFQRFRPNPDNTEAGSSGLVNLRKTQWFVFLAGILFSKMLFAQSVETIDNVTQTSWKAPAGCTSFYVEMWGGGGAGDHIGNTPVNVGTGRGGGGAPYVKSITYTIGSTDSRTFTLKVGKGGLNSGNSSNTGDNSQFVFPTKTLSSGGGYGGMDGGGYYHYFPETDSWVNAYHWPGWGAAGAFCSFVYGGGGGGSAFATADGNSGFAASCGSGAGTGGAGAGKGGDQSQDGAQPGGGGGGSSGYKMGGNGRIKITYYCNASSAAGEIGLFNNETGSWSNIITSPYPLETANTAIHSLSELYDYGVTGSTYSWERKVETNEWAPYGSNDYGSSISGTLSPNTRYWFRRKNNSCASGQYTSPVLLKVVQPNGRVKGTIFGKSPSTQGISGVTLTVQKLQGLPGSPVSKTYTITSSQDGTFDLGGIFYGDVATTNTTAVSFRITPSRGNDVFDPVYKDFTLSGDAPIKVLDVLNNPAFRDLTGYTVSGKAYQECIDCIGATQSGVDTVKINLNGTLAATTGYLPDAPAGYGKYSLKVDVAGTQEISATYRNHSFQTASQSVNVTANVINVNFKDITTRTISGKLRAGCSDIIGSAVLEFRDVLFDKDGNTRPSEFIKRTTTDANGVYSITLPARKYQVSVVSFTPILPQHTYPVASTDLINFFTTKVPKDSLTRDINLANATLNLTYKRMPVLVISGLDSLVCGGNKQGFAMVDQTKNYPVTISVYQGSPLINTIGCKMNEDTVYLHTNVPSPDLSTFKDTILEMKNGPVPFNLLGGQPNIVTDYTKDFTATYNDPYGRGSVSINRKVLVKGVKSYGQFNTLTTPQLPYMVLHDAPGSQSKSWWKTTKSSERSIQMFAEEGNSGNIWGQVKIGAEVSLGTDILGVSVSATVKNWGIIGGGVTASGRNVDANETIMSTTTTEEISTKNDPNFVGEDADVFLFTSYKLLYGRAWDIGFNTSTCQATADKKLIVAPNGFASDDAQSAGAIKNIEIPNLKELLANPGSTAQQKETAREQIKVFEQMLANNKKNIANAPFEITRTFSGVDVERSVSTTVSKSNTIEFSSAIDTELASELGFEVAGSGASGGSIVNFKVESGGSTTNSITNTTEFGYQYSDNDVNDQVVVDIKKDPVFGSPVFVTVGGQTSCPGEVNTTQRDDMELVAPAPQYNIPADGEAVFVLKLVNNSVEPRTYELTYNTIGLAQVTIVSPPTNNLYTIPALSFRLISVKVKRDLVDTYYSYEGLEFELKDICGLSQTISKKAYISAFFQSPCSNVTLVSPINNWSVKASDNNVIKVEFKDYSVVNGLASNLSRVALEYAVSGTGNWFEGFSRTANQLNGSTNGTSVDWNISSLVDGIYDLRLKLVCPGAAGNVIYTQRVTGIIDRTPPVLFGNNQPSDDNYSMGDEISFSFDESLKTSGLNGKASLVRTLNNEVIPVQISGFGNKVAIVPQTNLIAFNGEKMRIILAPMSDVYGNTKAEPDTSFFLVGSFTPSTGAKALQVSIAPSSILESGAGTMDVTFTLGSPATNDMLVSYLVGGSATFSEDYTASFGNTKSLNSINNTNGTIVIPKNSTSAVLKLDPKADSTGEENETVVISILEGGDYSLGANNSVTGTIVDASLSSPIISGPSKICPGSSAVLTASRTDSVRYASRVVGVSSEYCVGCMPGNYSSIDALGPPDVYPAYFDAPLAWSPSNSDIQREFLSLGFDDPAPIDFIDIFETFTPGAVDTVYVKNPNTNAWQMVYSTTAAAAPEVARILHITFAKTSFPVSEIRIAVNSPAVSGWNEIDAVGIGSVSNNATFKWSNGATTRSATVNAAGTYTCTVTNTDNGLSGKSEGFVVTAGTPSSVYAGPDQSYDQSSGNKFLGNPSPTGGTWSGTGVTGNTFSTLQSSGTYPVRYCYSNSDGCSSCDTILVTIRPPVGKCDIPVITPGTGTYKSNQTVTLSTKTSGATIYYTLSGNNPVIGAGYTKVYTSPITITNTVTLKAMAVKTGLTNSGVASAYLNIPVTANPVISPGTSVQQGNTQVSITCATPGAIIYYTTTGNKPRFDVPNGYTIAYTGPFTITGTATIWAVAKHPDLQYSYTVSALISIPPVRFNPGTGTYPAGQLVTMTNTTAGASIYYTTDGTVPTVGNANTKLYTAPVAVNLSTTIRAISYKNSAQDGLTAVGYYTIPSVANPVFSPGPGVCASPCQITITSATADARIWYTTGGFSPDSTKAYTKLYTGPITLLTAGTIKAQAYKKGFSNSGVVSGNYTVPAARVAVEGEEGEFTGEVQLFPNPTTGQFTVKGLPMEERLQIRIWNASGQEVRRLESTGQSDLDLNIGSETPGLYLMEIQTQASRKVLRIMKQ